MTRRYTELIIIAVCSIFIFLMALMVTLPGNHYAFAHAKSVYDDPLSYVLPPNSPVNPKAFYKKSIELLEWIAKNSVYKNITLPSVMFVDPEVMHYLYAFPEKPDPDNDIWGAYLYETNILMLTNEFQLGRDDFILLHELVHHMQASHGAKWDCMGQAEFEAYGMQKMWVEEGNEGLIPDALTVLMMSICGEGPGMR